MFDVVIIGAGMSGLSLAISLGNQGYSVGIVEKKQPILNWHKNDYNTRYSALNSKTCEFLKSIGAWKYFRKLNYCPMERMEVWDNHGGGSVSFNAESFSKDAISYVFENREIVRGLWEYNTLHPNIEIFLNKEVREINKNSIIFEHRGEIRGKLIVGADGVNSWLRNAVGITAIERPYYQSAITTVVNIEKSHRYSSYQPFFPNGSLGVLPCRDQNLASVVWSVETQHAKKIMSLSPVDFDEALRQALGNKLGRIRSISVRNCIPLTTLHARTYVKDKFALIGDAAHAIHPLAGQGANLGFMDALCLFSCIKHSIIPQKNRGNLEYGLLEYSLLRKSRNEKIVFAMRCFKNVFCNEWRFIKFLRNFGFDAVNKSRLLQGMFDDFVNN